MMTVSGSVLMIINMRWCSDTVIETTNGEVQMGMFMQEIYFNVNGKELGPFFIQKHSLWMFQQNLFTATSPFGNRDFLLSDRKLGVTKDLKASEQQVIHIYCFRLLVFQVVCHQLMYPTFSYSWFFLRAYYTLHMYVLLYIIQREQNQMHYH